MSSEVPEINCCTLVLVFAIINFLQLVFFIGYSLRLGENIVNLDRDINRIELRKEMAQIVSETRVIIKSHKEHMELQKEMTRIASETKVIIRKIIVFFTRNKLKKCLLQMAQMIIKLLLHI